MRVLTILATTLVVAGCSKTATIHLKDGTTVEGRIAKSGESALRVVTTTEAGDVPLDQIECRENHINDENDRLYTTEFICRVKKSFPLWKGSIPVVGKQSYKYDQNGRLTSVELDIGCDGTIEEQKKFIYDDEGKILKWEGDASSDSSLDMLGMEKFEKVLSSYFISKESDLYEIPIARAEIIKIDHPGKTAATVGTVLGVIGGILAVGGGLGLAIADGWNRLYCLFIAVPGVAISVPSAIVASWGYHRMSASRSAAEPPTGHTFPRLSPVALSDGKQTYWGLGMSWRW